VHKRSSVTHERDPSFNRSPAERLGLIAKKSNTQKEIGFEVSFRKKTAKPNAEPSD
jgi:hypothetical protein